ncbi:MAG: carboxypeptidase regulatory-like domain-containing protein [Terracidiphilus sp.]
MRIPRFHSAMLALTLLVLVGSLAFVNAPVAVAQTSNGTLIGAVTDTTGSAVAGANVTATSHETGAARVTTTNLDGDYRIESVLPGTYDVSVTATGFDTSVEKNVVVPGTSIITANVQIKVGKATEVVEVSADNSALNTDNASLEGTITSLEINNLPVGTLSPYELALTLPGVMPATQGGFSNGVNFEVGGGRPRANNFLIEGQDNNDAGITGQGLQPENLEAVGETKVLENNYTAEFGHGAGSVSNVIFKSGSNQFHGAAWERAENNSLDAIDKQDHFNGVTTPTKYRENLPGFDIGGPIIHNKVFAFGSYQWDYYRSSANLAVLALPTAAGIATLKALPADPRLANLLTAWGGLVGTVNPLNVQPSIPLGPDPTTGVDRGTVAVGTYQRNLGADTNAPELDLTGDYVMSQKDTLRLHLIRNSFLAPFDVFNFNAQLPGFDTDQSGQSYNSGIVETHVFNAHLVNDVRASYGRIGFIFGLPGSTTSNHLASMPTVSIAGVTGYGIPTSVPQGRFHNTYQLQDTLSWTRGTHFIKVGADLENVRVRDAIPFIFYGSIGFADDADGTPYPGGGENTFTYHGLSNLIDDYGGPSSDEVTQDFGSPTARPNLYAQNYFAEDTWRPISTLSIDYGVRYEYTGAPFNTAATPYPGIDVTQIACFPSSTNSCNSHQQPVYKSWGPRVGVAYSPEVFGARKTVIRSGFGVFYDVVYTNIIDNIQATAPAAAAPAIYSSTPANNNRGTASWFEQFATLVLNKSPLPTNTSDPIKNNLRTPMTMHWNLDIEQELPWTTSLSVSYVGERGEHLYGNTNLNPFVNDWFYGSRVVPTRGSIVMRDNSGDSKYNGLWAQVDHKINHNFLFRASYTYAKSLDDSSEIFTFDNESSYQFSRYPTPRGTTDWGPSGYDHRQRLVLAYTWQPSVWHTEGGMQILGNIVNRWAISGITQFQSGSPLNVEDGYDTDGDGIGNDRPVLGNPKAPMATYAFDDSWFTGGPSGGTLCSGPSLWFTNNPCEVVTPTSVHWIIPAIGTHPTNPVSRNTLTSPGFQEWDMNVAREFKLYENVTMQLRGELFNIFNHGGVAIQPTTIGPSVLNTSLISGIVTDAYSNNGTNTFDDPASDIVGHRHVRIVVKFSF